VGSSSIVSGAQQPGDAEFRHLAGPGHMASESILNGRMDKRLPIAMVVHLAQAQGQPVNGSEVTYTDNISVNGARVVTSHPWQTGEIVQVTPLKEETTIRGKVVYCQKLMDDRYCIGLNFRGRPITWSTFRTYSGT
jgi:PilZ domain